MAQFNVSQLTGVALDWAVWKIDHSHASTDDELLAALRPFNPSTNWAQGGPIIEREKISIDWFSNGSCAATINGCGFVGFGDSVLEAAMRCYVASKMGDVVDIPDDLTR